jgi:hypothetical protein
MAQVTKANENNIQYIYLRDSAVLTSDHHTIATRSLNLPVKEREYYLSQSYYIEQLNNELHTRNASAHMK